MARQNSTRAREGAHFPAFDMSAPNILVTSSSLGNPMTPFKALVKRLSEANGPSGSEEPVRELVREEIKGLVDQMRVDALGNLIAHRRGSGTQRKKIMLAAHLDEIGVMVTFVDERGFARFGALGAVRPLALLGARCQFANGAVGIIGAEEKGASHKAIELERLFIDVPLAASGNEVVRPGDAACFAREFVDAGDHLIGKALNNRIGCAVLIQTLRQLKKSPHDLFCVFTAQRQVGTRGASAAAYAIQPDLAFVVDTTPAGDVPGTDSNAAALALGKGPAVKFKDETLVASPAARQALLDAAQDAHVAHQREVSPHSSGDGTPIQAVREGIVTGALSIPLRYLHTTSEMVHQDDAQGAVQILATLLSKSL